MTLKLPLNILLFTLLAGVSTAQGQGFGQSKAPAPGKASQPSTIQPPPLTGAIGPPITFDTHEEYLRAYSTQRRTIDPAYLDKLRSRDYASTHAYNLNPFVKQQYCKYQRDEKKYQNMLNHYISTLNFYLNPAKDSRQKQEKPQTWRAESPIFAINTLMANHFTVM